MWRFQFLICFGFTFILLALNAADVAAQQEAPRSLWTRSKGKDWPGFLGINRDGKSDEKGILTDWSDDKLKIKWVLPLKESYGIGSVSRGRLIQTDRIDDQEVVICLNAETGKEIWRDAYDVGYRDLYGYNGGPRTSPVIDGNRVFTYGVGGELRCYTVDSGKLQWRVGVNEKFGVIQNFFGVGSTPVVYKDLLITMVGGSPKESQGVPPGALDQVVGNGSGIVAFDKRTGAVKYKLSDELASYSSPGIARINGKDFGLAFTRGGLLAFLPEKGEQTFFYPWRDTQLESVNASNPVVVKDEVLISETYGIGSSLLKIKTDGKLDVVWKDEKRSRKRSMETHWNTAIFHNGFFYGSSGRHTRNAELRCVQWNTGEVKWSVPGLTRSSLLFVDDHFVCLTETGRLFLFKANSEKFEPVTELRLDLPDAGRPQAEGKSLLSYPSWAAPILAHGLLYVRGPDYLVCLDLIPQ